MKVNVDGSVMSHHNDAGCSGIIRDNLGKWIVRFTNRLGSCIVMEAK